MGSNGIKIVKDGKAIETSLSTENISDFSFLSVDPTLMVVKTALVNSSTFDHNLGYKPFFLVYIVDDYSSPTTYTRNLFTYGVAASTTTLSNLPTPCYVILFAKNY